MPSRENENVSTLYRLTAAHTSISFPCWGDPRCMIQSNHRQGPAVIIQKETCLGGLDSAHIVYREQKVFLPTEGENLPTITSTQEVIELMLCWFLEEKDVNLLGEKCPSYFPLHAKVNIYATICPKYILVYVRGIALLKKNLF